MVKTSLGVVPCPECGFAEAQVRESKAGLAYRYCPDCNAQYFARTPEADARLRAKLKMPDQVPVTKAAPEVKKNPDKSPSPASPGRKAFALGDLA